MSISQNDMKIFGNLFVLEAANNHCGDVERGLKLIRDHAVVARQNNVRAAVKLQFRKMDTDGCFMILFSWQYFYDNHEFLRAIFTKSDALGKPPPPP